jgi:hypothetical protein
MFVAFYISNFNEAAMKKYSTWISITAGATLVLLILVSLIGKYFFVTPVYNPELFKFNESTNTLIIGASHSATSMDTDYIKNALSVATSGEPLYFTYYKAKALLKNNPQIKDVLVAISPIHVAQYSDKNLFQGNAGSRANVMNYYFLIDDLSDLLINKLSSDNIIPYLKFHWGLPFNYMSDLKLVLNYYTNNVNYTDYSFFGGEERIKGNHIEKYRLREKAKFYFYDENDKINASASGVEVIHRIASLSKQFNVKLTIISTPMHPYFIKQIPNKIQEKYDKTIKSVQQKYTNIRFIDLSDFQINEDNFLDGDHLNSKGITKFSQYLVEKHLGTIIDDE